MEQTTTTSSPVKAAPNYEMFNKFQTYFYTSIPDFENFTHYQIKTNAFQLLSNMTKAFPNLAVDIMDVYVPGTDFVKFDECPSLIKALQRKFVNGFSRSKIPQPIFYKSLKAKAVKKPKAVKVDKDLMVFSDDIIMEIKTILFYDSKTYETLKFSEKVQFIGKQLTEEFKKSELQIIAKSAAKARNTKQQFL